MVEAALTGQIIQEEEVEVRPKRVPSTCLDERVCLESCRKYFTDDAWKVVQSVVAVLSKNTTWHCGRCTQPISDETEDSIACDCCLMWFHFKCVGLKQSPKSKVWVCRQCNAVQ